MCSMSVDDDGEDTSGISSFPLGILSNSVHQDSQSSHVTAFNSGHGSSKLDNESTSSNTIRDVHISMRLMEDFLDLAKENTGKDLETCGIRGAYLEKGTLYMTTLIIPKQESASYSCQATNEEEVFKILNERSLYPEGWIHMMIPEAFAIVLAPNDTSRSTYCLLFYNMDDFSPILLVIVVLKN
ncbi:hypothetical protein AAZV13_02G031700 [Glycine max]|nr:hypothetical protein JHK85_003248 [Glycine max]KAG5079022.1 hypothetical protein JHK86_003087 [Glycine max]